MSSPLVLVLLVSEQRKSKGMSHENTQNKIHSGANYIIVINI